ncbi:MAG: MXAN_6640 family putative metalloprotease [Candidatus Zixiibacteriota bacterium]
MALLIGIVAVTASSISLAAATDPITAIEEDYRHGFLTLDERVTLVIDAVKNPTQLPEEYRQPVSPGGRSRSRMLTMVLRDAFVHWGELQPATRAAFSSAFTRPAAAYSYISLSGYFKLHYDITGTHQVPLADTNGNGVPDFVEKCAAYCDTALGMHDQWGFLRPPSDGSLGGDSLFDVYFEDMGYYGYAVPEGPGPEPWSDAYSFVVLNSDFIGFPPNNDPEGNQYGAAKATVAHELHHCVQFAYDYTEDTWYMELDATAWEDIVFNSTDDNYNYLPSFFDSPATSLLENSSHAYSCFIWDLYLAQKFDTSLLAAVWEGARYVTVFNAMSDTLQGRYGWTQDSAFADFTTWNYCTSTQDDGLHHEEAPFYPAVAIARTHSVYPVTTVSSPSSPAGYGSAYIEFYPGASAWKLRITFNGNDAVDWGVYVDKSIANSVHGFLRVEVDTSGNTATIEVPNFETYYRVTLIAANLSEFTTAAGFQYSAEVVLPYSVSSAVLTPDSAVYSGGERDFEYQVINTSPLYDVFDVSFWDDSGWVTPDTIDKAIEPGGDSIFAVAVHPPQGTPLGTSSTLYFAVRSRNDTMVTDSQSVAAVTVLQRGDIDFSGQINVADITYLVAYLFCGGPAPVPLVPAGDFDCQDSVNIADLTALVDYIFGGGGPPPCNPY